MIHIGSEVPRVLFKVFFLGLLLGKELVLALFGALLKVPELFLALCCALFHALFGGYFFGALFLALFCALLIGTYYF